VSRAVARPGLLSLSRARQSGPQTPHVAQRGRRSASRARPQEPGPASAHPNQRMGFREPEAPSTNKSHRHCSSFRPSCDRMGRHRCLGLAAEGPASNTLSRPVPGGARPKCRPAIRRSAQATCRLSASAMECFPSTPTSRPTSDVPVASHAPPDGATPFGAPPAGLSQARGWSAFRPLNPHHDDRSPWWIYPNLTDPSTSCHEPVSPCAWKNDALQRPCGVGLVTERIRPVRRACAWRTF